jgi:hypothetical protein
MGTERAGATQRTRPTAQQHHREALSSNIPRYMLMIASFGRLTETTYKQGVAMYNDFRFVILCCLVEYS